MAGARRGEGAVGSGHSFTDIACTDGVMVDLSRMAPGARTSTATESPWRPAITLHALGEELAARGLAMENQGDIDAQTLAGALSTATHGTGARFGNLSSQVAAMRLVTGDGRACATSRAATSSCAARVGLGALGVDLRGHAALRARLHACTALDEPRPLDDVARPLDELVDGADHFEFFVVPVHARAR